MKSRNSRFLIEMIPFVLTTVFTIGYMLYSYAGTGTLTPGRIFFLCGEGLAGILLIGEVVWQKKYRNF